MKKGQTKHCTILLALIGVTLLGVQRPGWAVCQSRECADFITICSANGIMCPKSRIADRAVGERIPLLPSCAASIGV